VPAFKFKSYQSGEQRCRIELTDDGLNVGETTRIGMHWDNVPIAGRGQRRQTKVDEVPRKIII